jgi:putative DNA primase/helicase
MSTKKKPPGVSETPSGGGSEPNTPSVAPKGSAATDLTALDWALEYASQGLRVLPLEPAVLGDPKSGKRPLGRLVPNGVRDASEDPVTLRRWWASEPTAGVGIAVPDDLAVVDVDPRNGGELGALPHVPPTLIARTGGGGWHVLLAVPDGLKLAGKVSQGIDVKQVGGYICAEPTSHHSGGAYAWENWGEPIAPAPIWLLELTKAKGEAVETVAADDRELTDRERSELDAAASAIAPEFVEGARDNLALAIGGFLRNAGMPPEAGRYLMAQLPSNDHNARTATCLKGWEVESAAGWSKLEEMLPSSALSTIAAIEVGPSAEKEWIARRAAKIEKRRTAKAEEAKPAAESWPRTDLGNARRLVHLFGEDLRYFRARKRWYTWDGSRWKADETGAIDRKAKEAAEEVWAEAKAETDDDKRKGAFKFAAECQNRARITNMIALAETEPGIPVIASMLDADPWLLNVQNGTLDLRTGELRAPDRALLMTKACAAAYEPGAKSALWDSFLETLTGGDTELAIYLQRAIGYALFGAWREKAFWFGYGPPDGGKSTFLGAVAAMLGDYAVTADASTWMVRHNVGGNRGDVTRLLGARLVTSLEVRASARFDQQLMKAVTGGDAITAAAKYEADIEFLPTFALWFGANDRPIIPDDDDAFWSRVRCVPFTNVIPKAQQDKALREKLAGPEHAPAVLAWAVAGCLEWQAHGIGTCGAVEEATAGYRRDMNQAAGFFDEHLIADAKGQVDAARLRARYDSWCIACGVRQPLQGKAWGKRLTALGATGGDDKTRVKGKRTWFGIRLRSD